MSYRPELVLRHPMWLVSLALYALNDHVLKGSGVLPTAVTGKLSDVAVLLVTPTVLAVLLGARSRVGWWACHAAMGALFVALELSPAFTRAWRAVLDVLGFRWVTWSDWTDLLTLPLLAASGVWFGAVARRTPRGGRALRATDVVCLAAASYVCLATSDIDCPGPEIDDPDQDGDGAPWSTDCDDQDPLRAPGQFEVLDDGIDQDCDGFDATAPTELEQVCASGAVGLPLGEAVAIDTTDGNTSAVSCAQPGRAVRLSSYVAAEPQSPARIGWLVVDVASSLPHAVAIRARCEDLRSEEVCGDVANGPVRALVMVGSAPTISVVALEQGGPAEVFAWFEPLLCGDGEVVTPETCDDGNRVAGDGCDGGCRIEGGGAP